MQYFALYYNWIKWNSEKYYAGDLLSQKLKAILKTGNVFQGKKSMVSSRVLMGVVLGGLFMLPVGPAVSGTVSGKITSVNVSSLPAFSCSDKSPLPNDLTANDVIGKNVVWLAKKKLYQVTTDHGPICVRRSTVETDIPVAVPEKGRCVTMGTADSTSASSNGLSGACN